MADGCNSFAQHPVTYLPIPSFDMLQLHRRKPQQGSVYQSRAEKPESPCSNLTEIFPNQDDRIPEYDKGSSHFSVLEAKRICASRPCRVSARAMHPEGVIREDRTCRCLLTGDFHPSTGNVGLNHSTVCSCLGGLLNDARKRPEIPAVVGRTPIYVARTSVTTWLPSCLRACWGDLLTKS